MLQVHSPSATVWGRGVTSRPAMNAISLEILHTGNTVGPVPSCLWGPAYEGMVQYKGEKKALIDSAQWYVRGKEWISSPQVASCVSNRILWLRYCKAQPDGVVENLTAPPTLAPPATVSRRVCKNGILNQPNRVVRKIPPKSKNTPVSTEVTFKYRGKGSFLKNSVKNQEAS